MVALSVGATVARTLVSAVAIVCLPEVGTTLWSKVVVDFETLSVGDEHKQDDVQHCKS